MCMCPAYRLNIAEEYLPAFSIAYLTGQAGMRREGGWLSYLTGRGEEGRWLSWLSHRQGWEGKVVGTLFLGYLSGSFCCCDKMWPKAALGGKGSFHVPCPDHTPPWMKIRAGTVGDAWREGCFLDCSSCFTQPIFLLHPWSPKRWHCP